MRARNFVTTGVSTLLGLGMAASLVLSPQIAAADPDAVKEAQKKVKALNEQSSKIESEYNQLAEKLKKADKQAKEIDADIKAQRNKVKDMKKSVANIAQVQFQNSRMGIGTQVLGSPDDTTMLKNMATVQSANQRANSKLQALQDEQAKLTELETSLDDTRASIKKDQEEQGKLLTSYNKKIDEAEKVLAKLTAQEKARLERLEAQEAAKRLAAQRAAEAQANNSNGSTGANSAGEANTKSASATSNSNAGSSVPAASKGAAAAVAYARAQIGKAYVTGAEGPNAFDCSGLTSAAWAQAGVSLPRTSQGQAGAGVPVSLSNIQPGDLVIFYPGATHVGIYVGGGMLVDAANPRKGVRIISINSSWMPIHSIRRVG